MFTFLEGKLYFGLNFVAGLGSNLKIAINQFFDYLKGRVTIKILDIFPKIGNILNILI